MTRWRGWRLWRLRWCLARASIWFENKNKSSNRFECDTVALTNEYNSECLCSSAFGLVVAVRSWARKSPSPSPSKHHCVGVCIVLIIVKLETKIETTHDANKWAQRTSRNRRIRKKIRLSPHTAHTDTHCNPLQSSAARKLRCELRETIHIYTRQCTCSSCFVFLVFISLHYNDFPYDSDIVCELDTANSLHQHPQQLSVTLIRFQNWFETKQKKISPWKFEQNNWFVWKKTRDDNGDDSLALTIDKWTRRSCAALAFALPSVSFAFSFSWKMIRKRWRDRERPMGQTNQKSFHFLC